MRALLVAALTLIASPVSAAGIDGHDPAKILAGWTDAVVSGDVSRIDGMLAPEFQILRASGAHHDHDGYVGSELPVIKERPSFEILQATESDGVLVVTYVLSIDATVEGQVMQRKAPRLTVFRKIDGSWYVVAHSNFAATGQR